MDSLNSKFVSAFVEAENWEDHVVEWLQARGIDCRRSSSDRRGAVDITTSGGFLLEVKAPTKLWNPPYVDAVDSWERRPTKPFAYINVPPCKHIDYSLWTPGHDPTPWKTGECRHHITKKRYKAYRCDIALWQPIQTLATLLRAKHLHP